MRINTNVSALNTLGQLNKSGKAFAKSVGRLSSGFRINHASDDAAGLGIANKMRADLRSMRQASRNAEQAGSLLQVAEGGAQTISQIVDRMKELATQAASDNVDTDGRGRIQSEFSKLQDEITRIVDTTQFQGSKLLDGSLGNEVDTDLGNSTVLAAASHVQSASISGVSAGTYTITNNADSTFTIANADSSLTQTVDLTGLTGQHTVDFSAFGISLQTTAAFDASVATDLDGDVVVTGGNTSFLVSSSGQYDGQDTVDVTSMDLSLSTLGIDGDSLGTKTGAQTALTNLDSAIGHISDVFGSIGAAQNRIDYAQQNTDAAVENVSAAESVIRDVDMAAEVTEMTKYQILQQAGTAMLAQANQAPQNVLTLLR
jgi:flagellin